MKKRILAIDDDAELEEEIAGMLEGAGYRVDTALDGLAGVALAARNHYDLFLLDFRVGGLDGTRLVREIRRTHPAEPILIISGKPGVREVFERENLSGEIVGVVEKPFTPVQLLAKVAEIGGAGGKP